ncbi:MAG: hypothetical protein AB2809_13720 [Candidatus Thiodiazotropha sp.]
MKRFHLNIGSYFERPCESEYSIIRRFYCVNTGISKGLLQTELRQRRPDLKTFNDRVCSLSDYHPSEVTMPAKQVKPKLQRQCPECARELYHANIFELPWVKRCPIHHCEILTTCPECKMPWPDLDTMIHRSCSCCGRIRIRHLSNAFSNNTSKYSQITRLHELIQRHEKISVWLDVRRCITSTLESWIWHEVDIKSLFYPSFLMASMNSTDQGLISAFNINTYPIKTRISRLHTVHIPDNDWDSASQIENTQVLRYINDTSIMQISSWHLSEYVAMRNIVHWISRNTSHGHIINLSEYREIAVLQVGCKVKPCLFCMSLSVWFLYLIHKYVSHCTIDQITRDLSMNHKRNSAFPTRYGLKIFQNNGRVVRWADSEFSLWMYQRSLELLFVEIYQNLEKQIMLDFEESGGVNGMDKIGLRDHTGSLYYAHTQNEYLYYRHLRSSPLDNLRAQKQDIGSNHCAYFHKHLYSSEWNKESFHIQSSQHYFSFKKFRDLLQLFITYSKMNRIAICESYYIF